MAKKGMKILPAILIPVLIGAAGWFVGNTYVKRAEMEFSSQEGNMPEVQLSKVLDRLNEKDYSGMYEASQSLEPTLDSKTAYLSRITEIFADRDFHAMHAEPLSIEEEKREYRLVDGDTCLGTLTLLKKEDGFQPAFPVHGSRSYTIEVPAGMSLRVGNTPVDASFCREKGVEPSNFFQVSDPSVIPLVDIYEITGVLDQPELNREEGYSMLQDVLSKNWLLGRTVTDEALKKELIEAAELIAQYPAMDTSLASVQAVSDTSSAWYRQYVTLQNYWFTAHSVKQFSNEHCDAVQQSDDTIVSHIYFDYFMDSGEYNRTWHVGYQLTFRKANDRWIVCGTELNSLLNPSQKH